MIIRIMVFIFLKIFETNLKCFYSSFFVRFEPTEIKKKLFWHVIILHLKWNLMEMYISGKVKTFTLCFGVLEIRLWHANFQYCFWGLLCYSHRNQGVSFLDIVVLDGISLRFNKSSVQIFIDGTLSIFLINYNFDCYVFFISGETPFTAWLRQLKQIWKFLIIMVSMFIQIQNLKTFFIWIICQITWITRSGIYARDVEKV